jgi:hypothetical protein
MGKIGKPGSLRLCPCAVLSSFSCGDVGTAIRGRAPPSMAHRAELGHRRRSDRAQRSQRVHGSGIKGKDLAIPLACRMHLTHRWRQPALPGAIDPAPATVAVAVGFGLPILLPQQHPRNARPAQLAMDMGPTGAGLATRSLCMARAGVKRCLQHPVGHCHWQPPAQLHCAAIRPRVSATVVRATLIERAIARSVTPLALEAQDLAYPSHRHSLGWHQLPGPLWPQRAAEPSRPVVE